MVLFRHQYQCLDEECYIHRYLARSFTHTASDLAWSFTYNPMKQRQMTLRTKLLGLIAIALVWLALWSRANNAASDELPPEHSPEPVMDNATNGVRKRLYQSESGKPEIGYVTVDGLGHHWPGGSSQVSSLLVGKPNDKLKATDAIWEFFKSHRK
jgi:poly(3-hydroxybutyrate) depolymerase